MIIKNYFILIGLLVSLAIISASDAYARHPGKNAKPAFCKEQPLNPHCGTTPTTIFDDKGLLHMVYVDEEWVKYTTSNDLGITFSPAVKITTEPEKIVADGENRPKIALGNRGEIYISWVNKTEGRYTGDVRFSRSLDNGKTFSTPLIINDDGLLTSHRFDTLAVNPKGDIYLTWLDKRDLVAAKKAGKPYNGSAVYFVVSTDNGNSFSKNKKVADFSCECCRIGIDFDNEGKPIILWRHIFGDNIRDHAISSLNGTDITSPIERVTFDGWQIDACPHHGPDMDIDESNRLHMTWFTGKPGKGGLHYGRYDRLHKKLENSIHISNLASASRPQVLTQKDHVVIIWKEFTDNKTLLRLKTSDDAGKSWKDTQTLSESLAKSDYPLLINKQETIYVSWWTGDKGLRLIPIETGNNKSLAIRSFTQHSLKEIELSHNNSEFILVLWSLDCPPCFKELKLLGELHKAKKLPKLVLVSTDGQDHLGEMKTALAEFDLNELENWYFDDVPERLRNTIDSSWFGELPRSYFYTETGQRKTHSGVLTTEILEDWTAANL